MTDPVRLALERIASTSPRLIGPCLPTEHGCCLCLALIDEARDALGWQRWPAEAGTPRHGPVPCEGCGHARQSAEHACRYCYHHDPVSDQ